MFPLRFIINRYSAWLALRNVHNLVSSEGVCVCVGWRGVYGFTEFRKITSASVITDFSHGHKSKKVVKMFLGTVLQESKMNISNNVVITLCLKMYNQKTHTKDK